MACSTSTRVRFRWPGFLGAAAIAVFAASVVACSDPSPATPRIFIASTLGPGSDAENNGAVCQLANGPWLDIGTKDGSVNSGDNAVNVTCTVTHDGDGFKVSANATQSGQGSLTIVGHFTTTGQQSKISGVFVRNDTATFRDDNCTVDYTADPNMGIAPGRVWGTLTCSRASSDQSSPPRVCNGVAEFKFENCAQ